MPKSNIDLVIDEEIELLEYVTAILRNKYKIIIISLFCAGIAFGFSQFLPVKYEAVTNIALVEMDSLGGVAPDNRRAPEMMTLLEHDFLTNTVYENYQERIMAKMRSRVFTEYFILKNQLLPIIFHKHWDSEKKQWISDFKPNMTLAARMFKKEISGIEHFKENNLMIVRIRLGEPKLAADLANRFVDDFNTYMREKAIKEADEKLFFLKSELKNTNIVEMRKSFFRLMEAQLVAKMLASNKMEYAIEVLDPAIPPIDKASPARKRITLLTFIMVFILSVVYIIGRIVFKRINASIKEYNEKKFPNDGHSDNQNITEIVEDYDDE